MSRRLTGHRFGSGTTGSGKRGRNYPRPHQTRGTSVSQESYHGPSPPPPARSVGRALGDVGTEGVDTGEGCRATPPVGRRPGRPLDRHDSSPAGTGCDRVSSVSRGVVSGPYRVDCVRSTFPLPRLYRTGGREGVGVGARRRP